MRDLTHLRLFLLAAMGLGPAAGCQDPATAPAVVPVDGAAAADTDAVAPADGAVDTTADSSPDTDTAAEVAADAVVDAAPDAAAEVAGDASTDAEVDAAADAPADIPADTAVDAKADTAADAALCSAGKPNEECFNAAQLKANIDNPPMGGDAQPIPYSGPLPPQGCPDRKLVLDGCCNPSQTEGVLQGDTCCYTFCTGACCGRPLMVHGTALVAGLRSGSPWAAATAALGSNAAAAAQAAAAWRADGCEEHAAIASFHRFGLELLGVGAPPALVEAAAVAAAEEVGHAQSCFAWARSLDGADAGPGPLALGDLTLRGDLAGLAVASALEGGIGETLAAAELGMAAALCSDRAMAARLGQMAADEARHAALAWQVVRWAIQQEPERVRPAVASALKAALTSPPAPFRRTAELAGVLPQDAHRFGRLTPAEAESCARQAMAEVVTACAQALIPELAGSVEVKAASGTIRATAAAA